MDVNKLREDYDFLYAALMKHPSILLDGQIKRDFLELYRLKADEISSYDSFINAATELTVFFRDGHTNIEVPYSERDFCIPLRCRWDGRDSRLLLSEKYDFRCRQASCVSGSLSAISCGLIPVWTMP